MMRQRVTLLSLPCVLLLLAMLAACGGDTDAGSDSGELTVTDVWSRPVSGVESAAPEGTSDDSHHHHHHGDGSDESSDVTGVVYMTIENGTDEDDRLLSVSTDVARVAEIHETTTDGDVMRMRMLEALEIPAGETVELEPAGHHIMLIGLHDDLVEGDSFELELEFEQHGTMTVTSKIQIP